MRSVVSVSVMLLLLGCGQAPPENSALKKSPAFAMSAHDLDSVRTTLTSNKASVHVGDTIVFVVTVTNLSNSRVQYLEQCGRGLDVLVASASEARSVMADQLGPEAFVPCVLRDEFFLNPKEQKTVTMPWKAALGLGEYTAQGGLWRSDGLANLSPPIRFNVLARSLTKPAADRME